MLISSRVTDARSAQQYASVTFVPLTFLCVAREMGLSLGTTNLLYLAGIFGVAVLVLFKVSRRIFHREEILTRWR